MRTAIRMENEIYTLYIDNKNKYFECVSRFSNLLKRQDNKVLKSKFNDEKISSENLHSILKNTFEYVNI